MLTGSGGKQSVRRREQPKVTLPAWSSGTWTISLSGSPWASSGIGLSGCKLQCRSPGWRCMSVQGLGTSAQATCTFRLGSRGMASLLDASLLTPTPRKLAPRYGRACCPQPVSARAECADDVALEAHGSPKEVKQSLLKACADFEQVIKAELRATVAISNSVVIASSDTLARRLRARLAALGGVRDPDAVNR